VYSQILGAAAANTRYDDALGNGTLDWSARLEPVSQPASLPALSGGHDTLHVQFRLTTKRPQPVS